MLHFPSNSSPFPVQPAHVYLRTAIGNYSPYYGRAKGKTPSAQAEWKHYSTSLTLYPVAGPAWKGQGAGLPAANWPDFYRCGVYVRSLAGKAYVLHWRAIQWRFVWQVVGDIKRYMAAVAHGRNYQPLLQLDSVSAINPFIRMTPPPVRAYAVMCERQAQETFGDIGDHGIEIVYPDLRRAASSWRWKSVAETIYWPDWIPFTYQAPAGAPWVEGKLLPEGVAKLMSSSPDARAGFKRAKRDDLWIDEPAAPNGTGQWAPSVITEDGTVHGEILHTAWRVLEAAHEYYYRIKERQAFAILLERYTHFYALLWAVEARPRRDITAQQGQAFYGEVLWHVQGPVRVVTRKLARTISEGMPEGLELRLKQYVPSKANSAEITLLHKQRKLNRNEALGQAAYNYRQAKNDLYLAQKRQATAEEIERAQVLVIETREALAETKRSRLSDYELTPEQLAEVQRALADDQTREQTS